MLQAKGVNYTLLSTQITFSASEDGFMRSFTFSLLLFFSLPVMAQTYPQELAGRGVAQNPTLAGLSSTQAINGPIAAPSVNAILNAAPGTLTISPLLTANPSGHIKIMLSCGTYYDNLAVTGQNIIFQGTGVNCTYLEPHVNAAVLSINASNANPIQYVQMRDMTLQNQGGFTSDGIDITGPANQINDWHHFENLNIEGFKYGVNLIGRTIWTVFENVHIGASLATGLYASTSSVINHFVYRDGQINTSQAYGVYWNIPGTNPSQAIVFDHVDLESNGLSGTQTNCAGIYLNGIGSGEIINSYMEANCVTNPDKLGADIRLDGTYIQAFDVKSSLVWSATNYSIYNTATQSTGAYIGNRFGGQTNDIKTSTTHTLSYLVVGPNLFNTSNNYVADSSGNTHVLDLTQLPLTESSPTVGTAACWKTVPSSGPELAPPVLGHCTTTVGKSGTCNCD